MRVNSLTRFLSLGLCTLLFALTGCTTLEYREVQEDFVNAVAADNEWSVSPFGANASEGLYRSIQSNLTDEYIARLDPRLQSNAWLLRAVSEWRTGAFQAALNSAAMGRQTAQDGQQESRDQVMLRMLDGLIVDSELHTRFNAQGKKVKLATYTSDFSDDFETGLAALDAGFAKSGAATPAEVGWYYHYQRWRLLDNWRTVVNSIEDDSDRATARSDSERKAGGKLRDLMDAERDAIPGNHPFRELIRALGGD